MPARRPEDCDVLFAEHVNARNLDALIELYEPTCSLVQHGGGVATGHAAIRAAMERLMTIQPKIGVHVVKVVPAGDGLALVYNDWTLSGKRPDGQPIEQTGKAIEVVRRHADGTWRFAADDPYARG